MLHKTGGSLQNCPTGPGYMHGGLLKDIAFAHAALPSKDLYQLLADKRGGLLLDGKRDSEIVAGETGHFTV